MTRTISYVKLQTPNRGAVQIDGSFPSGAAEDGTFPDGLLSDGYVSDAYGTGVKGVSRFDTGEYEVLLYGEYYGFISGHVSLMTTSNKDLNGQFTFPPIETITGTDGDKYTKIRIRVLAAGVLTDLEYNDRVNFTVVLDRSKGH